MNLCFYQARRPRHGREWAGAFRSKSRDRPYRAVYSCVSQFSKDSAAVVHHSLDSRPPATFLSALAITQSSARSRPPRSKRPGSRSAIKLPRKGLPHKQPPRAPPCVTSPAPAAEHPLLSPRRPLRQISNRPCTSCGNFKGVIEPGGGHTCTNRDLGS
ncbi:hypothetical protein OH77DRAFT_1030717 [Trametes cingulata]|nr:hypothetical protein OH77DRAFT_1030717 [Trametes cingulata]